MSWKTLLTSPIYKANRVRKGGRDPYSVAADILRTAWSRGRNASDGVKTISEGQVQRIVDEYNSKTNSMDATVSDIKRGSYGSGAFGMGSGYGMTWDGSKFVIAKL